VTGPASAKQNPVTVRDRYVPAAIEPPEQVAFPVAADAADAAAGSNGAMIPRAPAASSVPILRLSRGNFLI